tara:strand:+ start:5872 stop:8325 length:2454 start_codon:yes stop_codon:yes gene_type:complete
MYSSNKKGNSPKGFPDPLAPAEEKSMQEYGLQYAKAIENQWGSGADSRSIYRTKKDTFTRSRKYANGTQDTTPYKKLLTSLDPNGNSGTLLNLDYTPVPILPKFAKIVVNNILSRNPQPNVEAIDPLSSSQKDMEKKKIEASVMAKKELMKLKENGLEINGDPNDIPETLEEAEIFMGTSIKTDAEIAAQLGTMMTLEWNDFNDDILRRCVNDLVTCGMAVVKRDNDPNYGISTKYVDPVMFIHSQTEDPGMNDLVYAGHIKKITISELKRLAGDQLTEKQYEKIAQNAAGRDGNNSSSLNYTFYDNIKGKTTYGYDDYMVDVLDFEFLAVDCIHFEEKESKYGNSGFYYKGYSYKEKHGSVYDRTAHQMNVETVYGGSYVLGCNYLFDYGRKKNIPKNIHDISRAKMSYSCVAVNMQDMCPKSLVDSCIGFADMLQITHLKIQQSIAKAKPDGLIIDIEGLENVQLGKGGELQPLDLHDIYEQTGVFYYRSKNPEGGFQNPPVREIGNSIRNINELIGLYNHYLRLIRDATGINEVMDASTPKSDSLVGVREQAMRASNNAIYNITNASMVLYKKVCSDVVKCLQILPEESVVYKVYSNAIGENNMSVLSSFNDLSMYNFGVKVVKDMETQDKQSLEQMIQVSLGQQEIDLEDVLAIRDLKDINQAQRLLMVRRKKRQATKQQQQMAMQQQQQQMAMQAEQMKQQMEAQKMQAEAQIEMQKIQAKAQAEIEVSKITHEQRKEIEMIRAQATLGFKTDDQEFKEKLEVLKEDRKDERVTKQAVQQSKLISQRRDRRGELQDQPEDPLEQTITQLLSE